VFEIKVGFISDDGERLVKYCVWKGEANEFGCFSFRIGGFGVSEAFEVHSGH
jgi:hypothetical protein